MLFHRIGHCVEWKEKQYCYKYIQLCVSDSENGDLQKNADAL
jgi:hypothetical protein